MSLMDCYLRAFWSVTANPGRMDCIYRALAITGRIIEAILAWTGLVFLIFLLSSGGTVSFPINMH